MVDAPHQVAPIAVETDGPLGSSSVKEGLSLRDIGAILFKWKWLISACLLIGLLLGYVYSKTRIPLYEGTATIDLNPSQTNMGLSDLIQESLSSEDVRLPTEVARMQSNLVVFDTIKGLALQHRGPFPNAFDHLPVEAGMAAFPAGQLQAMVGSVRGGLKVASVTGTDIVSITYRDPRPQVAKDVPNTIIDVYQQRNLRDHMEGTGRVTQWLATEMEGLKKQATEAQARLGQYQKEHNLIESGGNGPAGGQADSLELDRLRISNTDLANAQADRIVREAKLRLAESNDPDLVATVAPSSTLVTLRAELLSLNAQYAQLTTRYGVNYPRVRELHNQIEDVQNRINTEMRNVQQRIREEYNTSTHTLDLMQKQLDKQMQDTYKMNESAAQYALLRQDAESSRQLYDQLQLKLKESNLAAGLNTASVTVIDEALLPLGPVSPDVQSNVMIAGALGLLVGVLGAFLFDSLDDTLRTTDDVELFSGLLSIGAIPHFQAVRAKSEDADEEPGERRRLVSITAPASPTAEAYRALRSSILLSAIDNPLRTLVITSAVMSEGKSTLCANIAVMLAQRGERVLIVDADLRRSTLHLLFGLRRPAQGLTNLLSRQTDESVILHPVGQVPTLAYLPAGAVPPNPAELLASHRMAEMMRQWAEQYDRVIIDTAPILAVSDSLAPAARADSVLLVVRAGVTRKKALMRTREILRRVNVQLLGAVVNDVDMRKDSYYDYSGPYTYGYGYTSESVHEEVK
jgi:polysaccharide biosynthesis transport protein